MLIPHRIRVSERATARLQLLKSRTGLTPNILSRFAFLLSIRDMRQVEHSSDESKGGMEFNAPTLFGEYQEVYEFALVRYVELVRDGAEPSVIIADHIENGLHKMGHIRKLDDLVDLT